MKLGFKVSEASSWVMDGYGKCSKNMPCNSAFPPRVPGSLVPGYSTTWRLRPVGESSAVENRQPRKNDDRRTTRAHGGRAPGAARAGTVSEPGKIAIRPKRLTHMSHGQYSLWLMVIPSIIRILIMVIINPYEPLDD